MRRGDLYARVSWPLVLLLAGLCCIGLALAEAQRSMRSNRVVAEHVLGGYSNFVLWIYRARLIEALQVMSRQALGSINHGSELHIWSIIPDASHLWRHRSDTLSHSTPPAPRPTALLGFVLGSDTLRVAEADPAMPASAAVRAWWHDTLTHVARAPRSPWWYQVVIAANGDASARFLIVALMPTIYGDTVVYATVYPESALASVLAEVLDTPGLLPEALTKETSSRGILSLEVTDAANRRLFGWDVPAAWHAASRSQLPASYGAMTIQLQIRPDLVERLAIGGLPRSRMPLLLALLHLAAGLTLMAIVQLRREVRFVRDRSAFVENISHELRTPLAQIRLATDTIRLGREHDPARREAALGLVDREVTRLQHLVDSVLHFSRGKRPGEQVPRTPTDVAAEMRRVVEEFAPLAAPRQVRIDVTTRGAPIVSLRAGALRQMLLNLLDNAVKYGPDGQTIRVQVEAHAGGTARLRVTDEGPGVAREERERIWRPFERGRAAARRAVGGSGIGLAVVREIAALHGGTATVEDDGAAGLGATFVVTLPRELQ